jgi:hypothetical protein
MLFVSKEEDGCVAKRKVYVCVFWKAGGIEDEGRTPEEDEPDAF